MSHLDVIIIGAGAAGMLCAATAAQRGRRVLIIDHAAKLAEKIRISGGGRCNFTNLHTAPEHFLSQNPDFCRSALARYTPRHFLALVERHNIAWHEKTLGQLFCDDSSQNIIDMLVAECEAGDVQWCRPAQIQSVRRIEGGPMRFEVATSRGVFQSASVVVASGGLAIPQIGATPFGYQLAEQFSIAVVPPKAALVPLTLEPDALERWGALSGVSFEARVRSGGANFREAVLLTHRGLSGPAILQISSYWQAVGDARAPIEIDLLPDVDTETWLATLRSRKTTLANLLAEHLPQRFAKAWVETTAEDRPVNQLSKKQHTEITHALKNWPLQPNGTQGYRKAEVTLGGVDTRELSSRTLESQRIPGLYFIGEVVDVTGHLGGFNFQWAWASAHAAGQAL